MIYSTVGPAPLQLWAVGASGAPGLLLPIPSPEGLSSSHQRRENESP